jgi:hypothetical protein
MRVPRQTDGNVLICCCKPQEDIVIALSNGNDRRY